MMDSANWNYIFVAILVLLLIYIVVLYRNYSDLISKETLSEHEGNDSNMLRNVIGASGAMPIKFKLKTRQISLILSTDENRYAELGRLNSDTLTADEFLTYVHKADVDTVRMMLERLPENDSSKVLCRIDANGAFLHTYEIVFNSVVMTDEEGSFSVGYMRRKAGFVNPQINELTFRDTIFSMLDSIRYSVQVLDVENGYKYVYVNDVSRKIYGTEVGHQLRDVLKPGSYENAREDLRRVYDTGEPTTRLERELLSDGSERITHVTKSLLKISGKKYVVSMCLDMSEQYKTSIAGNVMRLSLSTLGGFMWSTKVGSLRLDSNEELFKFVRNPQDVNSLDKLRNCVHIDDIETYDLHMLHYRESGLDGFDIEIRVDFGSGFQWWRIRAKIEDVEENGVVGKQMYGVSMNVQRRKESERQLADALSKTRESDNIKSAFISNISHEIRTPLNSIVGFTDLIVHTDDVEERKMYGQFIAENNEKLLHLVDDILDMSKLESSSFEFHIEEVDFVGVFGKIVDVIRARMTNPNVSLEIDDPCEGLVVRIDRMRVSQILTSFATNSVKFTQQGHIKMGYAYDEQNQELSVYVEDTGVGISEEMKARLFNRYEKLDNVLQQGIGFGLALTKSIVEKMGGRLECLSQEGKGTLIRAVLPASLFAIEYKKEIDEVVGVESTNNARPRVLVAEDNKSNLKLLEVLLADLVDVESAPNGRVAVDKMKSAPFDLVLMDIKMPVMDGLEATKLIRDFNSEVPIVALTANVFDYNRDTAINAGCTDFMAKPISRDPFLALVKKYVKIP